eukprot:c7941_g1_i1.p1 GENE.c7941_g1_i1~~c7941_g1_i1.p1  ORF type:complete len:425 (+),score=103.63 c7941_g1_i1:414-1688(+)
MRANVAQRSLVPVRRDVNSLGIPSPSADEQSNFEDALGMLALPHGLYMAGLPNFPRNFVRDSIITSLIMEDNTMLLAQLRFAISRQGQERDPNTGEEPGKMFHEYPGFPINGLWTDYNACDATALFVIGVFEAVQHDLKQVEMKVGDEGWEHHSKIWKEMRCAVEKAVFEYIVPHVDDSGFFFEDPSLADAKRFALKVTYWKDSKLLGTGHHFPVTYSLAHAQNYRAITRAVALFPTNTHLRTLSVKMKSALHQLFDSDRGMFAISFNTKLNTHHHGISSDSLTALYFLEPSDIPEGAARMIEMNSTPLETAIGYATETIEGVASADQPIGYHLNTVWPFEQALIHLGAARHGLPHATEVSSRVQQILIDGTGRFPELARVQGNKVKFLGCSPQLWSIAAGKYFFKLKHKSAKDTHNHHHHSLL